jgi:hypothetical protein
VRERVGGREHPPAAQLDVERLFGRESRGVLGRRRAADHLVAGPPQDVLDLNGDDELVPDDEHPAGLVPRLDPRLRLAVARPATVCRILHGRQCRLDRVSG